MCCRLTLLLLMLWPSVGLAQADRDRAGAEEASERAAARVLFQEGVELIDQERWADAEDRFSRALAITESPAIRFNLSHALTELGRLVEAVEQLRRVVTNDDASEAVRGAARDRLAGIEPRLARLTIRLEGADDVVVLRNDEAVPAAMHGVAAPVDPGEHAIVVQREGVTLDERTIQLAEGEADSVTFQVAASAPGGGPDDPVLVPVVPGQTEIYEEWWLWTIVGVVVVGAVLGITLGVTLSDDQGCMGDFEPCRLEL